MTEAVAPHFDGSQVCAQTDPEEFFPERGGKHSEARSLCYSCPFIAPCAEYALHHDVLGIWGATSENERNLLRKERGIVAEPLRPSEAEENAATVNRLFAQGFTLREIAGQLGKSHAAVKQIRTRRGAA